MRWFEDLIADATLPTTLSAADVPERDLPMLAADAMLQQRLLVNNPVEVDEDWIEPVRQLIMPMKNCRSVRRAGAVYRCLGMRLLSVSDAMRRHPLGRTIRSFIHS